MIHASQGFSELQRGGEPRRFPAVGFEDGPQSRVMPLFPSSTEQTKHAQ